jgi:hypothetical protein
MRCAISLPRFALHVPVSVVNWPGQDYYQLQMEAYREGANRLIGRFDWAAFNIDEFLFSSRHCSLPVELAEFGPEVSAIAVGHRVFEGRRNRAAEERDELAPLRWCMACEPWMACTSTSCRVWPILHSGGRRAKQLGPFFP